MNIKRWFESGSGRQAVAARGPDAVGREQAVCVNRMLEIERKLSFVRADLERLVDEWGAARSAPESVTSQAILRRHHWLELRHTQLLHEQDTLAKRLMILDTRASQLSYVAETAISTDPKFWEGLCADTIAGVARTTSAEYKLAETVDALVEVQRKANRQRESWIDESIAALDARLRERASPHALAEEVDALRARLKSEAADPTHWQDAALVRG